MEATHPSLLDMQLVASGSRPLDDALREALAAVWADVRAGELDEGQLLPPPLREAVERLHAFHFRGALWILHGDVLEQMDAEDDVVSVRHPIAPVMTGELGRRLGGARLEPAFALDERRLLWFLKGRVDGELTAFPVVFDASPVASERWQVLYPDLEVSPNDWRIAASEPRTLFATADEDVFELRGSVPRDGGAAGEPPVTTAWTLRLGRGRYHFGEDKALRACPPLLSTSALEGPAGRGRRLTFRVSLERAEAPVIQATRARCGDDPLVWFKPYDRGLTRVDGTLCRGSVQGDEAITLDVTSPDALTVRYWRMR